MIFAPNNDVLEAAVKKYAQDIVDAASKIDPSIEIEVEYDDVSKIDGTEKSCTALLESEYGAVRILPDFKNNDAKALILNRGLIHSMVLEDYSDEEIEEAGIYGQPLPHNKKYVSVYATFLTTDLGLREQKKIY